jgi:hypothetical protein
MSDFELRQLKAMRDELNRDFTAVSRPPPRRTPQHLTPAYPARTGLDRRRVPVGLMRERFFTPRWWLEAGGEEL